MNDEDIHAALESTTNVGKSRQRAIDPDATPNKRDVYTRRDDILRFLEELDGSLTVADVRSALEEYNTFK